MFKRKYLKTIIATVLSVSIISGIGVTGISKAFNKFIESPSVVYADASIKNEEALENADILYEAAFNAVNAAQQQGTQQSINSARTAIKALKGTEAEWAIGEFSKQVDGVQQKLFEGFLSILSKSQKTIAQFDINEARRYIEMFRTCEDTLIYVNTGWSQEVDIVQQKLISKADVAVRKAQQTKAQTDIDEANKLLDELASSTNADVVAWVKIIREELNEIQEENKVVFKDDNLEKAIRRVVGKNSGDIIVSDVNKIETLDLSGLEIKNISGLEKFIGLKNLDLSSREEYVNNESIDYYNYIEDITPLSELTNLEFLGLDYNKIENLEPLSKLTNIVFLSLSYCELTDISSLGSLKNVTTLDLSCNNIKSIEGLSTMPKLDFLLIDWNPISDLSNIEKVAPNLEILHIMNTGLTNLKGLDKLQELRMLSIIGFKNFTNENVDILKGIEKLNKLSIGLNLSDNIVNILKEALPNCEITHWKL